MKIIMPPKNNNGKKLISIPNRLPKPEEPWMSISIDAVSTPASDRSVSMFALGSFLDLNVRPDISVILRESSATAIVVIWFFSPSLSHC